MILSKIEQRWRKGWNEWELEIGGRRGVLIAPSRGGRFYIYSPMAVEF